MKYKYKMDVQKGFSLGGMGEKNLVNTFLCSSSVFLVILPDNKNVPDGCG